MLQIIFTTTENNTHLIAGATMDYHGRKYLKRVTYPLAEIVSRTDREKKIIAALRLILDQLKHPCRIALRTDLYQLTEVQWDNSDRLSSQHQITWSLLPPVSKPILEVCNDLHQKDEIVKTAEMVFG